jgi:cbb3-type cytochrome oxidase maturation protein
MGALYLLVPLAFLFVAAAVWAFLWAVDDGQFDDTQSPGVRILMDDDEFEDDGSERRQTSDR